MIQVGQVLDKYELLERVGQGGMAVVYRGLDRSLKRTVAVKILHKHLSDYQEARDRFEREAQAVAKLRHENILEIFDYAAKEGEDSYIVTEFIDGQTLKQFVTERPIAYPEIGAMIVLQVCRALAHAHAGGILHRDVKPENIMIRSDGIVKLMDFGISHMVDLERLTVTGQLLGSPAYMAPEHVEGRPLDFRTDVFAAGIVLYQLTVGKLPFEGKNPHEVLKRIAECKFVDPRQVNPRIGNRLGRIILRAMAAAPDGRYPAISEMVLAIEGYLEESGLSKDKVPSELARYFQAPASYELALRERLLDHLARRGQQQLDADDRSGALDVFDRVLTIDPSNAKVLELLGGLIRRARAKQIALAALACAVLGGGAWAVHERMKPAPPQPPGDPGQLDHSGDRPGPVVVHELVPPVPPDATQVATAPLDAPALTHVEPIHTGPEIDAAPAAIATMVNVLPRGSQYALDDGKWQPVPDDGVLQLPLDHPTRIRVRNDRCEPMDQLVKPGQTGVVLQMAFLAGAVVPRCVDPTTGQPMVGVGVLVNGSAGELGKRSLVTFGDTFDTSHTVKIEFIGDHVDHAPITKIVEPAQEVTVECVPR